MTRILFLFSLLFSLSGSTAISCTSFLVSRGASTDGSVMISYAADSHIRYGELYFRPGGVHPAGSMVKLYDRGTNRYLGEIPQAARTYNVVGFMNELQVAIGETTFGGRSGLEDSTGIVDYGSLMFLAMQRATSAREAIRIIAGLVADYGYCSSGESFSISDAREAWIMEIIGKGTQMERDKKTGKLVNKYKGAVWVAIRVPEGYISAHANQARITQFTLENGKTSISSKSFKKLMDPGIEVIYAHDVISCAREKGYFQGPDTSFSFSDVYAPLNFEAARFCEMRVWSMFKEVNASMWEYKDYASGQNLSRRMPLFIKPDRKLSPSDLMRFKRDYLQGTEFDLSKGMGAGPFGLPYRWRPLTWKVDGEKLFHERSTQTQQTGFSFIAQSRSWMPDPIGGINWFGVDDAGSTVYVPFYCGILRVPLPYAEGNGSILRYSETAAFWVFNKVANFSYLWYDRMIGDIRTAQQELESSFQRETAGMDQQAAALFATDPGKARTMLTDFSNRLALQTVARWEKLFQFLLVKFLDGNQKQEKNGEFIENGHGYPVPPAHPGYSPAFLKQLKEETGSRFVVPEGKP